LKKPRPQTPTLKTYYFNHIFCSLIEEIPCAQAGDLVYNECLALYWLFWGCFL